MIIFIWITHLAIPMCFYVLLTRHTDVSFNLFVVIIIAFYSLLPDLDHPNSKIVRKFPALLIFSLPIHLINGHRGITHSLLFSMIASSPLLLLNNKLYFITSFLACSSHTLLDMLTKSGVPVFFPYKRKFALKWLKTNSPEEYLIALACIMIILYPTIL